MLCSMLTKRTLKRLTAEESEHPYTTHNPGHESQTHQNKYEYLSVLRRLVCASFSKNAGNHPSVAVASRSANGIPGHLALLQRHKQCTGVMPTKATAMLCQHIKNSSAEAANVKSSHTEAFALARGRVCSFCLYDQCGVFVLYSPAKSLAPLHRND